MRLQPRFPLALILLALVAQPLAAQEDWQDKWYWGGQGGIYLYKTATQGLNEAISAGGHWLITKSHAALYVALDQLFFKNATQSAVPNASAPTGFTVVNFDRGRRIQASLLAIPTDTRIQPYAGIGLAIHQITNAQAAAAFTTNAEQATALEAIDNQSTKAFAVFTGGAQWRTGRFALFATYQWIPAVGEFLVTSEQHHFTGGLRFALTGASEDISTGR